jgi:dUTP pyrophosphatase
MFKRFINCFFNLIDTDPIKLKCVKLDSKATVPIKANAGLFEDAAFDLYAVEDILLQSGGRQLVGTKLSFIIPDGYWLKLRERSGLANKGIHILGGVIDSGYTGEVKVIMYNSNHEPVSITKDKAICQFTVERLTKATIKELSFASFTTEANNRVRGTKGFGSSDVKH